MIELSAAQKLIGQINATSLLAAMLTSRQTLDVVHFLGLKNPYHDSSASVMGS